jgi:hypothetical protein
MQHKLIVAIFIPLFCFAFTATGQKIINSPYSRFNLGTLESPGSFRSLGMGGVGISMRDNSSIYSSNPASYSSLDTISFVFDFGLDYGMNYISDGVLSFSSDDMDFDHLVMGFPLAKGWGVAIGVVPFSNGYYNISQTVIEGDPGYDPIAGEYTATHLGEGGLNSFFIGSGINISKNLSVGINMTLLFGQLKRTNQFDFADYYNVFHNNSIEKLQIGGINFDYGIQYSKPLKNDYFFNAGISINTGKNFNSKYELLSYRYTAYGTRDTISYNSDDSTPVFIPGTLKTGVSIGKRNKFTAGVDFLYTRWSVSKIPGSAGYAANSHSVLFGFEYIPDRFSNYSLLKRMEYRIGGHIGDNYLIIDGEQVKEYGASIGIGLPIGRSLSKTNLFFDFTRKTGSMADNIHNENYYSMGISLNLYDNWFIKKKYY